ncbi:MAG: hypothetical protein GY738_16825, partial [Pseudoalteromonas sp.]|nr:hypothetical protein [Pseudoalteromonas sp.]
TGATTGAVNAETGVTTGRTVGGQQLFDFRYADRLGKAASVTTLKPFDPDDKERRTWSYFCSDFESHCRLYRLEVADWVTILSYFLLGKAKELFYNEAAIVGGQDNLRYDVLEAKLCAMFEVSHPVSYWVTRFQERFWNRAGETLDTFVADLRLSSSKAFPNLLRESESFVYMQLHRCLSPREKEWCFHHNATTPNDILRVLEQKR